MYSKFINLNTEKQKQIINAALKEFVQSGFEKASTVVSHTRKEEDLGLTELVRSFQIGRQANSLATIAEVVFINVILASFISGVMISFGVETISVEGSFLFGASVGIAGIIGAGIALVMAQIMPTSSGATGSSLGIVGLLYIVRAGTDISNIGVCQYSCRIFQI